MDITHTIWVKEPEKVEELTSIYKSLSITYKSEKIDNQWKIVVSSNYHRIVTLAEDIAERLLN